MATAAPATGGEFRLYEITDEMLEIEAELVANGGELTPEIEAKLDAYEGAFEVKVRRIIAVIRQQELLAAAAKSEMDRLNGIRQARSNTGDRLKEYLKHEMERLGKDSVETPIGKAAIEKNGRPSIRWGGDMKRLPRRFRKEVEIQLSGRAAYDAYRQGTLPKGFLVETGNHLKIR